MSIGDRLSIAAAAHRMRQAGSHRVAPRLLYRSTTTMDRVVASRIAEEYPGDRYEAEPPIDQVLSGSEVPDRRQSPGTRLTPDYSAVPRGITAASLEDVADDGRPSFRPELGRVGGVSWFVTQDAPSAGTLSAANGRRVDIAAPRGAAVVEFREPDLLHLLETEMPDASALAERQFRLDRGLSANTLLDSRACRTIERNTLRIAERSMWQSVGREVAASDSGLGRVVLEGSRFARQLECEFTLTSEARYVSIKSISARALVASGAPELVRADR